MNELTPSLEQLRCETPATATVIHFNNAGASLQPRCVTDAVIDFLRTEQKLGGYEAAALAHSEISEFYTATAQLLNCHPEEVAFVENATRGWQLALSSIRFAANDVIVTTTGEYASNYLELLHLQKRKRVRVLTLEPGSAGQLDLAALENLLEQQKRQGARLRMLCLTHIPSQRGDVQPAEEVGRLARDYGMYYLLDACQSAGQLSLDVNALGCDFLCASGRKYLRGPRGTGFLYINRQILEDLDPPFIDLHSASWNSAATYNLSPGAQRFEIWERNIAGQIGLSRAIQYCNELGIGKIESRIRLLQERLHSGMETISGVRHLQRSTRRSGIVSFYKDDESSESVQRRLSAAGINCSLVRAKNAQLDVAKDPAKDACRASLHYYNSEEEIDRFLGVLAE